MLDGSGDVEVTTAGVVDVTTVGVDDTEAGDDDTAVCKDDEAVTDEEDTAVVGTTLAGEVDEYSDPDSPLSETQIGVIPIK